MIFSNASVRVVAFSKIGDFISGGWPRRVESPPAVKSVDTAKIGDASGPKPGTGNEHFDQNFVDSKVGSFAGPGHASGTRQPGDVVDGNAHESPGLDQYKEAQQQKWQIQKDAEARDKLFAQPAPGQVNGREVEPFSSHALEENAKTLSKASGAKADRALSLQRKDIAKVAGITASITVPLTIVGTFGANIVLEVLKPLINPPATPATEQRVMEGRVVDHSQKSVFLLLHSLAVLRSEEFHGPSVEWISKTNDERMDYLEEMLDYLEPEFAKEAQKRDIAFQAASTGGQLDDIKSRAASLEPRMAALNATIAAINKANVKSETVSV